MSPVTVLAANPLGQIVRQESTEQDLIDSSGLLSLVEPNNDYHHHHQQQHQQQYNNSSTMVGIKDANKHVVNNNASSNNNKIIKTRNDALNDLIANLSNGSDKSNIDNYSSPSSACHHHQVYLINFISDYYLRQ